MCAVVTSADSFSENLVAETDIHNKFLFVIFIFPQTTDENNAVSKDLPPYRTFKPSVIPYLLALPVKLAKEKAILTFSVAVYVVRISLRATCDFPEVISDFTPSLWVRGSQTFLINGPVKQQSVSQGLLLRHAVWYTQVLTVCRRENLKSC
jgi:hypothetical protein